MHTGQPVPAVSPSTLRHQALLRRFTGQPDALPAELGGKAGAAGGPVELYAWVDLNERLEIEPSWLILTRDQLILANDQGILQSVSRVSILKVKDQTGLSGGWFGVYGEGDRLLLEVRFSNRQRRAVEHVRFVLQQQTEGITVRPSDAHAVYAEAVAGPIREAQSTIARNEMSVIWRLLGYFRPYKKEVTIGFVAAVIMTLLNLAPPYFTKILLDDILKPVQDGRFSAQQMLPLALTTIGALGMLFLIREVSAWFRLRKLAYLGEYVAHDLRQELYAHLQRLSLNFFSKKQTGSIITRVSSDTDRLWEFLAFGVVEASLSILMLAGLGVVLVSMDLQLGLIMILPVPLFLAAYYFHGKVIGRRFLKAWRKWSDVSAVLSDTIPACGW